MKSWYTPRFLPFMPTQATATCLLQMPANRSISLTEGDSESKTIRPPLSFSIQFPDTHGLIPGSAYLFSMKYSRKQRVLGGEDEC